MGVVPLEHLNGFVPPRMINYTLRHSEILRLGAHMKSLSTASRKTLVRGGLIGTALVLSVLVLMPGTVREATSVRFLPHVFCYLNDDKLIALHFVSDALIWLSYVSIALTLAYLVRRTRREIPYSWMFLAFGTFIIACGFTHFMEMVVLWKPLYWLSGDVKLVTALASVVTAIALPPLVPQIQSMVRSAHLSEARRLQLEKANDELQHLSAHLLSAQDRERRRIARELHDDIGQYLIAMKMSIDVALSQTTKPDIAQEAIKDCFDLLQRCTKEIRTMSYLLHPPLLEEGLATAVPWYVEGFTERSGIKVSLHMPAKFDRLPQPIEMVLFRLLQESLTNIHRHSASKLADIRLELNAEFVTLIVSDKGKGFDVVQAASKVGVGIAGMRERVREIGGEFTIHSQPGGTTIRATIPLEGRTARWHSAS